MLKRILIPIYTGLGDCVFILPVIESLKIKYPSCEIDLVGDNKSGGNELFMFDSRIANIFESLPDKKYDIVLNCTFGGMSLKQLMRFKLRNPMTRIITHRFIKHKLIDNLICKLPTLCFVKYNTERHVVYNNLSLLRALDINEDEWQLDISLNQAVLLKAQELVKVYNLKPKNYIVIQVGAAMNAVTPKKWPITYWVELICYFKEKNEQVVLVGSKNENEIIAKIPQGNIINLCGKSNIVGLIGLLCNAKCFIGVDSGIDKLMALVDTPSICLWGPISLMFHLDKPNKYLVSKFKKCSPCTGLGLLTEQEAYYACKFNYACMYEIKPIDVYNVYLKNI